MNIIINYNSQEKNIIKKLISGSCKTCKLIDYTFKKIEKFIDYK